MYLTCIIALVTKNTNLIAKHSLGLKYVKLSFTNNHIDNSNKADATRPTSGQSKNYARSSGPGDYFPGGMDSANTEAQLISRNYTSGPGGKFCA